MIRNLIEPFFSEKLKVQRNPLKGGQGVYAKKAIHAGELLIVWDGEPVNGHLFSLLPEECKMRSVQIGEDLFLAVVDEPQQGDYINHSCEPNVGVISGHILVALRNIQPGEEVCFDYAMTDGDPYDEFDCECNTDSCRGRITGNDWQLPVLQEKYKGFFSPYLQKRIENQEIQAISADLQLN